MDPIGGQVAENFSNLFISMQCSIGQARLQEPVALRILELSLGQLAYHCVDWSVEKLGLALDACPCFKIKKSEATQFGHSVCFFILFCCGTLRWSPNPFGAKKKKQSFWEKAQ